jgi:pimeloyl-ACP methyl ester carboxylesterase
LLFLHGYLSSKEAFTAQINYFSRYYKVTAIDFVGFGKSPPLTEAFSVKDYADWLYGIVEGLGLKKPHVVAHSFGCRVAIKMAAQDKECFDKILLTGAAGVILKRSLTYKIKVKTYRFVRRFAPRFAERKFGSAEYKTLSSVMKESYKKIVNEDLRGDAQRIENSVLIVQGRGDSTTPIEEARAYLQNLKGGTVVGMDGGHFAFMDDPLTFNLIAEEFFYDGTRIESSF